MGDLGSVNQVTILGMVGCTYTAAAVGLVTRNLSGLGVKPAIVYLANWEQYRTLMRNLLRRYDVVPFECLDPVRAFRKLSYAQILDFEAPARVPTEAQAEAQAEARTFAFDSFPQLLWRRELPTNNTMVWSVGVGELLVEHIRALELDDRKRKRPASETKAARYAPPQSWPARSPTPVRAAAAPTKIRAIGQPRTPAEVERIKSENRDTGVLFYYAHRPGDARYHDCPYSQRAFAALSGVPGLSFVAVEMRNDRPDEVLRAINPTHETLPVYFQRGKLVGDSSQILAAVKSGAIS